MPSLDELGWTPFFEQQVTEDERARWRPGRIVSESRERYRISTGEAEWQGVLSGHIRHAAHTRSELPVAGDWVLAAMRPAEQSATIHRLLARRSRFSRAAAGRSTEEQIVAANIDTLLLVTSLNHDFNLRRLERYLALTWESGACPVIVLNKSDLCTEPEPWRAEMARAAQGVRIVVTSAQRGDGMAELHDIVRTGGTTALLGSSGVGKSTLINALLGENRQGVLPIRDRDERGRHSTTARQLFCLRGGGMLIDTPGMRELQLWDAETGLQQAFADVQRFAADCRFRDCSHENEPGCAVKAAAQRAELDPARLESYHRLMREDDFLRSRTEPGAQSKRSRKAKQIAKAARLHYKLRRR